VESRIENVNIIDLVKGFGSPLFVYSAGHIRKQFTKLSNAFKDIPFKIHYAMKANENPAILEIIKNAGGGIDAVSPFEIDRALNMGFDKDNVVFTPSCPHINEIKYALAIGVKIHIGAIEYFPLLGQSLKDKSVGLRINPAIGIGGNQKIATAHQDSKFGIPINYINKIKEYQQQYGFVVNAIHIHTGSNIKDVKDLKKTIDYIFNIAKEFDSLQYLDIGSGLKIKYRETDHEIDIDDYAAYIKSKLQQYGKNLKIIIEPGKFLVGNAGILVTKVNIVKKGYKKYFAGVNSGFHHLIRPMYYDAYHEIVNISNPQGEKKVYDVVGQLCEEDTFAYDRELNEVRQDDILIIKSAGAYAYSMSMEYNLRKKPKEILIDGAKVRDISQV